MVPQTKVFVGSLPQGSRPEELRKLFERFGVVTECDIMNRCGFVHMQTEEEAGAAIRALHNSSFNGGVITVERGRIKERGQRGGGRGGGMRGGMRNGGGMERRPGGPMRGPPHMGGRDQPYMRDRPMGGAMRGDMRGHMGGGMPPMRNGMGGGSRTFDTGMGGGGYADDRYGGYGGEDRRGFALMDNRARDPYAAPYGERRGYGADDMPLYDDRAHLYDDMIERRAPYTRPNPMPNGDMFSRRTPDMRGQGTGGYERDPYAQQYPPMGRAGGGGAARGGRDFGGGGGGMPPMAPMAPRRY